MSAVPGRATASTSMIFLLGVVLAGFVCIALAWRAAARTLAVGIQIPALMSGGLVGISLVFVGAALLHVQVGRQLAADEREELALLIDELSELSTSEGMDR